MERASLSAMAAGILTQAVALHPLDLIFGHGMSEMGSHTNWQPVYSSNPNWHMRKNVHITAQRAQRNRINNMMKYPKGHTPTLAGISSRPNPEGTRRMRQLHKAVIW